MESPTRFLSRMKADLEDFERTDLSDHDRVQGLLIDFGDLETGVTDALFPEIDSDHEISRRLRGTAIVLGHLLGASWRWDRDGVRRRLLQLTRDLEKLLALPFPGQVHLSVPEGYAYYSLYPETYLESALKFFRDCRPAAAVCIGIRSIGSSLSAVVGAALEEMGCPVRLCTVRPRGHPFRRFLSLSPELEEGLRKAGGSHFLIVDEGPGMSGSSMTCVADRVSALGVPDERIVFFPSWLPDQGRFISETARNRWPRHIKYVTSFEETWVESSRLARSLPFPTLLDVSAGMWRPLLYPDESAHPAVQPQHERRKYLCSEGPLPEQGKLHSAYLIKFAGLGAYGRSNYRRAREISDAGLSPPVVHLKSGFIVCKFLPGRPLSARDTNPAIIEALVRYLLFRKRAFPSGRGASNEAMLQMIRTNVREGLGKEWTEKLHEGFVRLTGREAVAVDGRMMPHKWFRSGKGLLKTDGWDHHEDHFYPGGQDIAWDVAGCFVEFDFGKKQREEFMRRYVPASGDRRLAERLPSYLIAYLAFRLGYAALASDALGSSPDGVRFRTLAERYAAGLKREIRSCRKDVTPSRKAGSFPNP